MIVSGPAGTSAAFTPAEIVRIRAMTQRALWVLSIHASVQPTRPKLVWAVQSSVETVAAPPVAPIAVPSLAFADREPREAPWRDAALQGLVGQTGELGLRALRAASIGNADHAILVWWTRYETSWSTYAVPGVAQLVMGWPVIARERGGRGLEAAARALVHEICHLFGAEDEYSNSHCTLLDPNGEGFGELNFPNFNCENVSPASVPCTMRDNVELLCPATIVHLGWVDSNLNGTLDVFE
jgi:hypothetical protein